MTSENKQVCIIQVPYMLGDERQGGSKGPPRLLEAGAVEGVAAHGIPVTSARVERGKPFRDSVSASLAVNQQLAQSVRRAIGARQSPLILAGSCDVCMGILAGLDHSRGGVVWFDAHGDFNTPETTVTGFFGGMCLAVVTGHCYQNLWTQLGNRAPIPEDAVLMLGVRDLDPLEQERLHYSPIQVLHWREGKPQADVRAALDRLAMRVQEVYLHIDLDALDPRVAPGIVDPPVPGGLGLQDMEQAVRAVADRFRIHAAALTTYNPELDEDDKTLRAALRIIEVLVQCQNR